MQNFEATNKEHYGMLWYFWNGQFDTHFRLFVESVEGSEQGSRRCFADVFILRGAQRLLSVKYLFGEENMPRIFYYLRTAKNF